MSTLINKSRSDQRSLAQRYEAVRAFTDRIVAPLSPEDCMVQSMDDVSPTRWHLAHTSWFFETFLLSQVPEYKVYDPQFNYLFNSYYNQVGDQFPRPQRGFVSRPGLDAIKEYRRYVDRHMLDLLTRERLAEDIQYATEVGLNHEQQHQELMLTDIKHVLSCNPMLPAYQQASSPLSNEDGNSTKPPEWLTMDEGVYQIGHHENGFWFDNEGPRHRVFLEPYSIHSAPVTNRDFLGFIRDDGYLRPDHWLSMGWAAVQERGWKAPLYWVEQNEVWKQFTLAGLREVQLDEPICHLSYFEADAFARWAGCRLPTEFEWEATANQFGLQAVDHFQFADLLLSQELPIHPGPVEPRGGPQLMFGGVWEWTSSSYAAYPGYSPPAGALGEYNGKFMCNQYVLRGGSVATSQDHIRLTYRNFFPPHVRWQFSGLRLAKS